MKNQKQQCASSLLEILIVVIIVGLIAAIAIPNFVRVREESRARARTYEVTVCKEDLVNIANQFGADGVTGAKYGYGDALVKNFEVVGDTNIVTATIRLVTQSQMTMLTDPTKGEGYRNSTLREVISLGLEGKAHAGTEVVVLGTYKVWPDGNNTYPILIFGENRGGSLMFGLQKDWSSNALFAVTKL
jgi:Tfp pilus assembly protein PilE